jgi:hypothetical protein
MKCNTGFWSNVKLCSPLVAILDWEQNNILREQDNMLWEQNNILREQDNMLWEQNNKLWEQDIILREQNKKKSCMALISHGINVFSRGHHLMRPDFKCTEIVKY